MANNGDAIVVKNLRKSFGKLSVLKGIDIRVKRGSILALLGPNGAGKTTMVKILSTLIEQDGGSATIEGFDTKEQAADVRSVIGLTGQYAAIDEYLTGRENLRMMGQLYHLSRADADRRCEELLKQFGLTEAADRVAKTYSGGMSRRLDLAASLIATPPVIFLDEPTTGLDPRSRLSMWAVIEQLARDGSTILLTTQYLEEADQLADQIAVLDGGRIIAQGTSNELKEKVGKERVELTFSELSQFRKAKSIIAKSAKTDEERLTISIVNDGGVRNLRQLLEKLENAKIAVDGLSLHKPTLDDVFLHLTGHGTEEEQNSAATIPKRGGHA